MGEKNIINTSPEDVPHSGINCIVSGGIIPPETIQFILIFGIGNAEMQTLMLFFYVMERKILTP